MIGTTRSRVSFFMNRFRKMGFIHYDATGCTCTVPSSLSSSTTGIDRIGSHLCAQGTASCGLPDHMFHSEQ